MALFDEIAKNLISRKASLVGPSAGEELKKLQRAKAGGPAPAGAATPDVTEDILASEQREALRSEGFQRGVQALGLGQQAKDQAQRLQEARASLEAQAASSERALEAERLGAAEQLSAQEEAFQRGLSAQQRETAAKTSSETQEFLRNLASEKGIKEDSVFQLFGQGLQELSQAKDQALLEQVAFAHAMKSKAYVQQLQQIGAERRLEDEMAFKKEAAELTWDEDLSRLKDQLGWQSLYNYNERRFSEEMAQMSIEEALKIADIAARGAAAQQAVGGATKIASSSLNWLQETDKPLEEPVNAAVDLEEGQGI